MPGDELRVLDKAFKGRGECGVPLLNRLEEAVVSRFAFRRLPDAFDAVELGRVRRQAPKLDAVPVRRKPGLGLFVEPMARTVVDDQEDLPATAANEFLEEQQKRVAIEDRRELVIKARPRFDRDRSEYVPGPALTVGIDPGLLSDWCPGPVQAAIEPEACFVLERYDATASRGFFLIFGNVSRSQTA